MAQNMRNLLFPRAKWNTAQVKLVLLSASQVAKSVKASEQAEKMG